MPTITLDILKHLQSTNTIKGYAIRLSDNRTFITFPNGYILEVELVESDLEFIAV